MKSGLSYGVGINDADYTVNPIINGRNKMCLFFSSWQGMLERSYSQRYHALNPTYKDCSVCKLWLRFSEYKKWMEAQDWEGKDLDKDILVPGNKVYSPLTCCFVSHAVNSLLLDRGRARGDYPQGVYYYKNLKNLYQWS